MPVINYYYKGWKVPNLTQRYEVVSKCGDYPIFEEVFLNKRKPNKGGLSFNYRDAVHKHIKAAEVRKGGSCLGKSGHISSLFPHSKFPLMASGNVMHPIKKELINDALLVILSYDEGNDKNVVELFVSVGNGKLDSMLLQELVEGKLDAEIDLLRSQAITLDVDIDWLAGQTTINYTSIA